MSTKKTTPVTRKGFVSLEDSDVITPVHDAVGLFVPEQSLSIREIIAQFSLVGTPTNEELSRGFNGDDTFDDDGYTDLNKLDIAELQELSERANTILDDYRRQHGDV